MPLAVFDLDDSPIDRAAAFRALAADVARQRSPGAGTGACAAALPVEPDADGVGSRAGLFAAVAVTLGFA